MAINLSKQYIKSIKFPGMDEPYYFYTPNEVHPTDCPNCGAGVLIANGFGQCEYCGTMFGEVPITVGESGRDEEGRLWRF